MRTAALAGSVAVLALLAAFAGSSSSSAHSCVKGNELPFRAPDGVELVGHRFGGTRPTGRTTVVLAHMSEGDLCDWVPYARSLARQGFFVFPFDLRGHGHSKGRRNHRRAAADLASAVRAVRGLGARRVVVVGASLGGIAALVSTPALTPPPAGVVAVSAPTVIAGTLDARPSVSKLRAPTLYVSAIDDRSPPYDFAAHAKSLYEATATNAKRLELVPGAQHGIFLVSASSAVRRLLLEFFRDPGRTVG
jgi:alpha-beta hydrolase superfamily lysophospholipase